MKHEDGAQWWLAKDETQRCVQANATAESIATMQGGRQIAMATYLRAYRSRINAGYMPQSDALRNLVRGGILSLNVIRAVNNTMIARVGKNKPRSMFLTKGGTAKDRAKAAAYQFYVDGSFHRGGTRKVTKRSLAAACVFGTGVVRTDWCEKSQRIVDIPLLPASILIDPRDGAGGNPRQLHEVDWIDKGVLAGDYPEKASEIEALCTNDEVEGLEEYHLNFDQGNSGHSRKVKVVTSYHLPSYLGAEDGRCCVSANGVALSDGEWTFDRFPHSFLRWAEDPIDFWGSGLAEELLGIQNEINYTIRKIQLALHLVSAPYILADKSSGIDKTVFNGKTGNIIYYVGREPRIATWDVVSPELFAHLDRLFVKAFELSGVSPSSASGEPSSNLRSGRGALVEDDKQTVRFSDFEERWEDHHNDIAEMHVLLGMENKENYEVAAKDNQILRAVKASELDLDRDAWRIQRWPGSLMPETPSGRMQAMEQLMNIYPDLPPMERAQMLGDNDMDYHLRRLTAPQKLCEKIIEAALTEGKVTQPDAMMPLDLLVKMGQEAYCLALLESEDPDYINSEEMEALRTTLVNAQAELSNAEQKMAEKQAQASMATQVGIPAAPPIDPRLATAGPTGMPPVEGAGGAPTDPSMM